MGARRVSAIWGGAERDVLTVLPLSRPGAYGADPSDRDDRLVLYRRLDDRGEATGEVVGVEIDGFPDFDRWEALPALAELWQLLDREPVPPTDLLRRLLEELGAQGRVATPA